MRRVLSASLPLRGTLLGLGLLASTCGQALDEDRFTLEGFGTLGLTYNADDDFEYVRDLLQSSGIENEASTKVDSSLGLQLTYRFLPELQGVVQVVSRHDEDGSFPPEVTWAYLKYSLGPTWEIRGGRTSWDVFMLSDSRNVGYSFLWVRPPIEYFGVQQLSHIDGIDAVFARPVGQGLFWFKLYGGYADEEFPLDSGNEYDLSGSRVLGGHANYQLGNWWFRLGFSELRLDNALDSLQPLFAAMRASNQTAAELADDMQLKGSDIRYWVLGAVYERGPFQLQAMLNKTNSGTLLFNDYYAGYATISYRLDKWTPYLSFAAIETDRISRDSGFPPGHPIDRSVQSILDGVRKDQNTTAVGVRYDFKRNIALKLQAERLWSLDSNTSLMRRAEDDWDGRATILSATVDFVF